MPRSENRPTWLFPLPEMPLRTLPLAWIVIHSPKAVPAAEIEPSLITLPVPVAVSFRAP